MIFWKVFVLFQECVDWGISKSFCVRVLEVNTFRYLFPERGWKPGGDREVSERKTFRYLFPERGWKLELQADRQGFIHFPIPFPRKGMETVCELPAPCRLAPFRYLFPERGWKQPGLAQRLEDAALSDTFSPKGDGNLPLSLRKKQQYFPIPFPRKGMETSPGLDGEKCPLDPFRYLFPERGWKRLNASTPAKLTSAFRYLFPERGWKLRGQGGRS